MRPTHVVARAEELVGDVERGEHGDLQAVSLRTLPHRQPHLLVHVRRELRHVGVLQRAADRIALAVNLDVDDAGFGHTIVSRWSLVAGR